MAELNNRTSELVIRCRRKDILKKRAELNNRVGQETQMISELN